MTPTETVFLSREPGEESLSERRPPAEEGLFSTALTAARAACTATVYKEERGRREEERG